MQLSLLNRRDTKIKQYKSFMCRSFAVAILFAFVGGCGDKNAGEQFRRLQGPPHQRLKWKAGDFFTDPGVLSLCKAIEAKDVKEIERLVASGVDVNAKGRGNMTPLMWAFPMGEDAFKKVLELGANPNIKLTERVWTVRLDKGTSVTSASASPDLIDDPVHGQYFHDVPMDNYLRLVLEHGGDPNIEDMIGETPLFYVRMSDRSKVSGRINLLLNAGADINHRDCRGRTPVMCVAGHPYDAFHVLLKQGADYRIADNEGSDAVLWLASQVRFLEDQLRERHNDEWTKKEIAATKPIFDWLANEGVNWEAARAALQDQSLMKRLKDLPADYQHRPWLPQRPTLNKPDAIVPQP